MLALILAGGRGSRLNMGEKPLVTICGRPMIEYVLDAFALAGCETMVVASPQTPYTRNWCRAHGIALYSAGARGYVADIVEAVTELGEEGPVVTSVSDIPCITPDLVARVQETYLEAGTPALSTWVPAARCTGSALRLSYQECIDGVATCPAGVNILLGARIAEEQEEYRLLVDDPALGLNVNTRADLALAARRLCPDATGVSWSSGHES
ncbi:5-deoxyadenosylcobinamide phosphate nucleotidyltransferase [Methanofollis formosanus]|uniref:5-deoxyadenosylcobinamide phosphate nucleotidyltransferase n=1 Tax=Methanofollis formosanus TaxID=299308 RepID=A0A8G1EFR4_9EURY|nr:NTP transferase domain-containing protein [Methanofollis formosanus]QYZ78376.1 5-deoxyadenosylcobinamide phosphate nucleotidyltransferase [Methanofollis formosanus]